MKTCFNALYSHFACARSHDVLLKCEIGPDQFFPVSFYYWKNVFDVKFWSKTTTSVTPLKLITTHASVFYQSLRLLLLVILRRRSRFADYIGRLGQAIFRQKTWLNDIIHGLFFSRTRIFFYVFKDNSSRITRLVVRSGLYLFDDFRFLSKQSLWLILATSCFVLAVLGRPEGFLVDSLPRVIRAYHLYTVVLLTVLFSLL